MVKGGARETRRFVIVTANAWNDHAAVGHGRASRNRKAAVPSGGNGPWGEKTACRDNETAYRSDVAGLRSGGTVYHSDSAGPDNRDDGAAQTHSGVGHSRKVAGTCKGKHRILENSHKDNNRTGSRDSDSPRQHPRGNACPFRSRSPAH